MGSKCTPFARLLYVPGLNVPLKNDVLFWLSYLVEVFQPCSLKPSDSILMYNHIFYTINVF